MSEQGERDTKKQKVDHQETSQNAVSHAPLVNGTYNTSNLIREDDLVMVYVKDDDVRPIWIKRGQLFNCSFGQFPHESFINQSYGSKIILRVKERTSFVLALRPTPNLWTLGLSLRTQILYHADISLILQNLYLRPGSRVVESGTGSGSLSTSIARCIAPTGRLFTFEYHEQRHVEATNEFKRNGIDHVITTAHADAYAQGFNHVVKADASTGENAVDAVFLDLPKPWICIDQVNKVLKRGGRFCGFSPCIEQVQKTADALRNWQYVDVKCYEILAKNYENSVETELPKPDFSAQPKKGKKTAPAQSSTPKGEKLFLPLMEMRGHTGYLLFATRFYELENPRR